MMNNQPPPIPPSDEESSDNVNHLQRQEEEGPLNPVHYQHLADYYTQLMHGQGFIHPTGYYPQEMHHNIHSQNLFDPIRYLHPQTMYGSSYDGQVPFNPFTAAYLMRMYRSGLGNGVGYNDVPTQAGAGSNGYKVPEQEAHHKDDANQAAKTSNKPSLKTPVQKEFIQAAAGYAEADEEWLKSKKAAFDSEFEAEFPGWCVGPRGPDWTVEKMREENQRASEFRFEYMKSIVKDLHEAKLKTSKKLTLGFGRNTKWDNWRKVGVFMGYSIVSDRDLAYTNGIGIKSNVTR